MPVKIGPGERYLLPKLQALWLTAFRIHRYALYEEQSTRNMLPDVLFARGTVVTLLEGRITASAE
jgi:hypothetical protein